MTATRVFSQRQWGKGPGAGFNTRQEGYGRSRRIWVCLQCRIRHEHAKPTECRAPDCLSGSFFMFDSAGECQRFMSLWFQQDHGLITSLRHHPRYDLHTVTAGGVPLKVAYYEADSVYIRDGLTVVEDFKPGDPKALDPVFKLKRRIFEAQYGLTIRIVS